MSAASGLRNAAAEISAPAVSSCPGSRRASARVLRAWNIEDLRGMAKRRLPRAIFDFFDGAAEDEITLRENRAAFERVRIAPKMLTGVEHIDTSAAILGARASLPIAVGPTGGIGFGWPFADVGVARAAAAAGIPYTLSTMATASIERIAREAGGRVWFQAYIFRQRDMTLGLVERARQLGCEALMVTVDVPVGGKRERDFRNDFAIRFRFTPRNVLDFASHPGWVLSVLRHGMPVLENVADLAPEAKSTAEIASSVGQFWDADFDWDGLKEMRDRWPRKMLVKGILRADEAERLAAMGIDAVVVSNHGGRQLDGAVAALDALPPIVRAVKGRMSVLVDGGVRRGVDVVKALALGAEGVMLGRATLYGACAAGEAGAARALQILGDELVRAMQLSGVRSVGEIGPDLLAN
ncbi:MAG: alpha-hydroxy-acid oxidizing protein [Betaproteobacteria bacterium]|nr:MAG: alpha-hydroxy-acid oxidizing protein [Betaproteobacteria bacterium]